MCWRGEGEGGIDNWGGSFFNIYYLDKKGFFLQILEQNNQGESTGTAVSKGVKRP